MNKNQLMTGGENHSAPHILTQIVQDWRSYLIGVGSCYPPDENEYRLFFERMAANVTDAESLGVLPLANDWDGANEDYHA